MRYSENLQEANRMKPEVKDSLCGSRAFYISMHLLCIGMMALYDNDMKDDVLDHEYAYPFFYLCLLLASAYLFWTSGNNPGYAPYELEVEMRQQYFEQKADQELGFSNKSVRSSKINIPQNSFDQQPAIIIQNSREEEKEEEEEEKFDQFGNPSQIQQKDSQENEWDNEWRRQKKNQSGGSFQADEEMPSQQKDERLECLNSGSDFSHGQEIIGQIHSCRTSGTNSQRSSSNTNLTEGQQEAAVEMFYCEKCMRHQPFRSKHCDECGRCILKFDHHWQIYVVQAFQKQDFYIFTTIYIYGWDPQIIYQTINSFWIGGCVGELNHRKFWLFLFFQTILIYITFMDFFTALDRYIIVDKNGSESYTQEYGAFAVLCFILFIFFLFTGVLCLYHLFLILSNQTTWEHHKRTDISYTKRMPKGFYPFSEGMWNNIVIVFCHGNQSREWKVPTLKEVNIRHKNGFNIFENEYYSCC